MQFGSLDDEDYLTDMEALDETAQRLETFVRFSPLDVDTKRRLVEQLQRDIARETSEALGYTPTVLRPPRVVSVASL